MDSNTKIQVPKNYSWFIGDSINNDINGNVGGTIELSTDSDIIRYLPIIFDSNGQKYRYILRIGFLDNFNFAPPLSIETDIVFTDWNTFVLNKGERVSFSIDNSQWYETAGPIKIDRTKNHIISWHDATGEITTLEIPAKPSFSGVPIKGFTNESVTISLPNTDFLAEYVTLDGATLYSSSITIDTIK